MNVREAIAARRSIRRFKDIPVPDGALRAILEAGTQAPSGKNHQPWRFAVVGLEKRSEMIQTFREGINKAKLQGRNTGSSEWTAAIMEQAPVTVFVFHPDGVHPWVDRTEEQSWTDVVNLQSIGAAIQNMLLAALDMGIGSLWIADVFWAYEDLLDWLDQDSQMIAAISFGYPDESPGPRPRMGIEEVTAWT